MRRIVLAALTASATIASAFAGGPGGTWTCSNDKDAPVLTFEIAMGGDYGHTYRAAPLDGHGHDGVARLAGTGDLDHGIAPDGGSSWVAVSGPMKDGGWWATHRGVTVT